MAQAEETWESLKWWEKVVEVVRDQPEVYEDSPTGLTQAVEAVLLSKVVHMEATTKEVLLAHLKPATEEKQGSTTPTCRLVVLLSCWRESYVAIVHPIDVDCSRDSRTYTLKIDPSEIH